MKDAAIIWYNETIGDLRVDEEVPYQEDIKENYWIINDGWVNSDLGWEFVNWVWKQLKVYDTRQDDPEYDGDITHPKIMLSLEELRMRWTNWSSNTQRMKRLEEFKTLAISHALKFVRKVDLGKARSKETYADMKELLTYR